MTFSICGTLQPGTPFAIAAFAASFLRVSGSSQIERNLCAWRSVVTDSEPIFQLIALGTQEQEPLTMAIRRRAKKTITQ